MHSNDAVEHAKKTVLQQLSNPLLGRTFGHLLYGCGFKTGRHTDDWVPETRVLDRALQALKRDGLIWYDRTGWRLTRPVARSA